MIVKLYRGAQLLLEKHYPDPVPDPDVPFRQCVDYLVAEQVLSPEEGQQMRGKARQPEEGGGQ